MSMNHEERIVLAPEFEMEMLGPRHLDLHRGSSLITGALIGSGRNHPGSVPVTDPEWSDLEVSSPHASLVRRSAALPAEACFRCGGVINLMRIPR